jgi:integrase
MPRWETVGLRHVHYTLVARWVGELDQKYAASTVVKIVSTFSKIMKDAMRARLIASSPVEGVRLPKIERKEVRIPTAKQVALLTEKIDPRYRAWTITAAYSGLRFGELAGLRWGRVNVLRLRIEVVETAYQQRSGEVVFNQYTKTSAGRRLVPVPAFVMEALGDPQDPDGLVFTRPEGRPLARSAFRDRVWLPGCNAAKLTNLTPHHLRHYAISLWVASGADLIRVKTWAGHSQLRMLDLYAHLMPDDERDDLMTEAFGAIARKAAGEAG